MIWVHNFARAKTLKWILQQHEQRKTAWIHYSTLNNLFLLLHTYITEIHINSDNLRKVLHTEQYKKTRVPMYNTATELLAFFISCKL